MRTVGYLLGCAALGWWAGRVDREVRHLQESIAKTNSELIDLGGLLVVLDAEIESWGVRR